MCTCRQARTRKKPFEVFVRDILNNNYDGEIRIGKGVCSILQSLIEEYIINVLKKANMLLIHNNRDTLMAKDLKILLKINESTKL